MIVFLGPVPGLITIHTFQYYRDTAVNDKTYAKGYICGVRGLVTERNNKWLGSPYLIRAGQCACAEHNQAPTELRL
jgi:hypothetical protein